MKQLYYYLLVFIALASCEKPVTDVDIPKAEKKVAVFCVISPQDSIITAEVSYSAPVFLSSSKPEIIKDATVILSNGSKSVLLTYDAVKQKYVADTNQMKINYGESYTLNITTQAGEQVSAACRVPDAFFPNFTAEPLRRKEDLDYYIYRLLVKWTDQPGVKNYYRVYAEERVNVGSIGMDFYNDLGSTMFEDKDNDGKQVSVSHYFDYVSGGSELWFDVYLLNVDEHYYKYHEGRIRYEGDNPFAEPNIIYSNVQGGLGCFGAFVYNRTSVKSPW